MREMRVGWRLKTKDGLLDIWTTALLDISRCLGGRGWGGGSSDGFEALERLSIPNSQGMASKHL